MVDLDCAKALIELAHECDAIRERRRAAREVERRWEKVVPYTLDDARWVEEHTSDAHAAGVIRWLIDVASERMAQSVSLPSQMGTQGDAS